MKTLIDYGIDTKGKSGQIKVVCPKCSNTRKNRKDPSLSVNTIDGTWCCHHCGWVGGIQTGDTYDRNLSKIYFKPSLNRVSEAIYTDESLGWLINRGISESVIARNRVGQCMHYIREEECDMPCIQFPYFRGNELINIKYRQILTKNFAFEIGAERILYGINDINSQDLIIVEGEIDKLSMEEAGYINCVSVPNGANNRDLNYFDIPELSIVKNFIIAVDNDDAGTKLKNELVAKLGAKRCFFVRFPEGCKDANEVLINHGKECLSQIIEEKFRVPVEGIFNVNDFRDEIFSLSRNGYRRGNSTGWENLDSFFTVRSGEVTVVTGIPGHGKSELLDALCLNLAISCGYKTAMYSPENDISEHATKLIEKYIGKSVDLYSINKMDEEDFEKGYSFVLEHFREILPKDSTIEIIIDRAEYAKLTFGMDVLTIDPWNYIERKRERSFSETEYVSDVLSKLKDLAKSLNIHIFVVAHPRQQYKDTKSQKYTELSPYEISGSANFYNKADNILIIDRNFEKFITTVHVKKIRSKAVGKIGKAYFKYDNISGRFIPSIGDELNINNVDLQDFKPRKEWYND